MSFGALSAQAKESLGRGASVMGTSTTTGDGIRVAGVAVVILGVLISQILLKGSARSRRVLA